MSADDELGQGESQGRSEFRSRQAVIGVASLRYGAYVVDSFKNDEIADAALRQHIAVEPGERGSSGRLPRGRQAVAADAFIQDGEMGPSSRSACRRPASTSGQRRLVSRVESAPSVIESPRVTIAAACASVVLTSIPFTASLPRGNHARVSERCRCSSVPGGDESSGAGVFVTSGFAEALIGEVDADSKARRAA